MKKVQVAVLTALVIFSLALPIYSNSEKAKAIDCDFLTSSTEKTKKTVQYTGTDIFVYNPSTICGDTTRIYALQTVKVNDLKVTFKINTQTNRVKIPLTELNIKMNSNATVELRHYSFAKPEFLNK